MLDNAGQCRKMPDGSPPLFGWLATFTRFYKVCYDTPQNKAQQMVRLFWSFHSVVFCCICWLCRWFSILFTYLTRMASNLIYFPDKMIFLVASGWICSVFLLNMLSGASVRHLHKLKSRPSNWAINWGYQLGQQLGHHLCHQLGAINWAINWAIN